VLKVNTLKVLPDVVEVVTGSAVPPPYVTTSFGRTDEVAARD